MAEPKQKKPKLFQLAVMNELVKQNSYLQAQYDRLSENAEDKYGYHWNEVIQNIIFGRFIKYDEKLKAQYDVLALKHKREKKSKKKAKKAAKKASKGQSAAPHPDAPAVAPPPIVSATGEVDTRLAEDDQLAEQSTGGASYSYETPFFLTADAQTAAKHSSKMADMVGAKLMENGLQANAPTVEQPTPSTDTPMTESPQARALHDPDMLDFLFENYFQTGENALRPSSQVRIDELKKENEKSAKDQLQHAAEQNLDFTQKLDDDSATVKPVLDEEGVDAARRPDAAEEKHVRLNRGINVLDQTLIAQPKLDKNLLDRYREQAGAEFKNSEEKVEQYNKKRPEQIDPARVTVIKEGTHLTGRLNATGLYSFDAAQSQEVAALPAGAERLEMRGLANGHGLLRESYEFYVDLPTNQVLRIPTALAPAPEPIRMKRADFDRLQHMTFYKSSR